jgi:hypothetical protein
MTGEYAMPRAFLHRDAMLGQGNGREWERPAFPAKERHRVDASQKSIPTPMRTTAFLSAREPAVMIVSDRMNARLWPMDDLSPAARNGRTRTHVCSRSVASD